MAKMTKQNQNLFRRQYLQLKWFSYCRTYFNFNELHTHHNVSKH